MGEEREQDSSDEESSGLGLSARQRPGVTEGIAVPSSRAVVPTDDASTDIVYAETEFSATNVSWSTDGQSMVLKSDKHFCLAYPLAEAPQ